MSKTVFKAGQEVVANKDFDVEGFFGEEPIKVKQGSKAFVSADGFLHHTTGAARGKIQMLSEDKFEVKGYDHENIAKMIYEKIARYMEIDSMLEDYDMDKAYLMEVIEEAIEEIL